MNSFKVPVFKGTALLFRVKVTPIGLFLNSEMNYSAPHSCHKLHSALLLLTHHPRANFPSFFSNFSRFNVMNAKYDHYDGVAFVERTLHAWIRPTQRCWEEEVSPNHSFQDNKSACSVSPSDIREGDMKRCGESNWTPVGNKCTVQRDPTAPAKPICLQARTDS